MFFAKRKKALIAQKVEANFFWTFHSKIKMAQYGLSPNLIKRVIRFPERKEEGVAPQTIAVMKTKKSKNRQEIWVMYQNKGKKKKVISTWIYPGESPIGKEIFVPDDVWEALWQELGKEN